MGYYYLDIIEKEITFFEQGKFSFNINNQGTKSPEVTLKQFEKDATSNYFYGYIINNDGDIRLGKPNTFWTTGSEFNLYLKGENFGGNTVMAKFQFYRIYNNQAKGIFTYRLKDVFIPNGSEFTIGSSDNYSNYGGFEDNYIISKDLPFTLNIYNAKTLKMNGDFKGDLYIVDSNTVVLYLVQKN